MNYLYSSKDFLEGKFVPKECIEPLLKAQEQAMRTKSTIVKLSKKIIDTKEKKECSEKLMEDKGWNMWEDPENYYFTPKKAKRIRESGMRAEPVEYDNRNTWWKPGNCSSSSGWEFKTWKPTRNSSNWNFKPWKSQDSFNFDSNQYRGSQIMNDLHSYNNGYRNGIDIGFF
jgi:hypothetical protein